MKTKIFGVDVSEFPTMGVLGHAGEYRPRYGLWLDTSPECQNAVRGILAEGYTCDVVLKLGARCAAHGEKPFRPIVSLEFYAENLIDGGELETNCAGNIPCYMREAFFPNALNLRRRGNNEIDE